MPSKKAPRKQSEAEFQRVFNEVRADINELQLQNKVFVGVVEELAKHPQVGSNFPGFFHAFGNAMRSDLVIRLGRVYDPEGTGHESCTLPRCLLLLRDNPQFFTDAAITVRLRPDYREANPDFLRWHRPDVKKLEADLVTIERSRKRLINLRHKVYAHKDLETVLSGKRDGFLSSQQEVNELIQLAHEIWNRHSQVWNASTYSAMTIGEDDYKWLFNSLRRGMKVKKVIVNRQTERWMAHIKEIRGRQSAECRRQEGGRGKR